MTPDNSFQYELHADVLRLHKDGLNPDIEPRRIPALAELAKALSPASESHGRAVEVVLKQAIDRAGDDLLPVFPRVKGRPELLDGLKRLWGLFPNSPLQLEKRGDLAGPPLGYPNGYQGLKGVATKGVKRWKLAAEQIAAQLFAMAEEAEFEYRRVFGAPAPQIAEPAISVEEKEVQLPAFSAQLDQLLDVSRSEQKWVAQQRLEVQGLYGVIYYELGKLPKRELTIYGPSDTSTLTKLARHAYEHDDGIPFGLFIRGTRRSHTRISEKISKAEEPDAAELLDGFLTWIVELVSLSDMRQGFRVLLAIGPCRTMSPKARADVRDEYFGFRAADRASRLRTEDELLKLMAAQILKVASRVGYVTVRHSIGVWWPI
jgi:hypothetical protein